MPLDALGDLVLTVGADLSGLESTLQSVPAVAQSAGAAIDQALGSSLDGATQSLNNLSNAVSGTGGSAGGAIPPIESLGAAVHNAGEQASTSSQVFDHFLATFAGFTAAELAIKVIEEVVAAIKELAVAAVESFAQMERFQVEMTRLTGSSDEATMALDRMKTLAISKPFEFEELARAEQRMTAFGISTSQVNDVMRAAMDAAAATGNSFNMVANTLERVEVTGSIGARQLNQLGISWEDLAKTAGKSVQEIQEAVKKGGQGAAADMDLILKTVESKFAGAADALANTLQGQFTIVHNEISLLLGGIGEDFAPFLRMLMAAFQSDLLPALQNVVAGLHDLAPAFGVIGTAAKEVISVVSNVIEAFGDVEKIVGFLGQKLHEAAETDITVFKAGLMSLGVEAGTLDKIAENADFVWQKFKQWLFITGAIKEVANALDDFSPKLANTALLAERLKATTDALSKEFAGHISYVGQMRLDYVDANKALDEARQHFEQIQAATIPATEKTALLAKAQEEVNKAWKEADPVTYAAHVQALKDAHDAVKNAIQNHSASLAQLTQHFGESNAAVAKAAATLTQAQAAYDAGKISVTLLTAAQEQYAEALKKADPLAKLHMHSLEQMGVAYDLTQEKVQLAKGVLDQATASLAKIQAATDGVVVMNGSLGSTFVQVGKTVQETQAILNATTTSLGTMAAAQAKAAEAAGLHTVALQNLLTALNEQNKTAGQLVPTLKELQVQEELNMIGVQQATAVRNAAIAADDGSVAAKAVLAKATADLEAEEKKAGIQIQNTTAAVNAHTDAVSHLGQTAQGTSQSLGRIAETAGQYGNAISTATRSAAVHVETLQQLTNHEIALQGALDIARATMLAAQAAYDGSGSSLAILNAAIKQFKMLLDEADPSVKQGTSDADALASAYRTVAQAAGAAGTAIKAAGEAAMSLGQQLDITMGGMQGALHGVTAGMEQLISMFGGYQSPLGLPSGVTSMGPGYSSAGMNQTRVGGEVISESQVVSGTLGPAISQAAAAVTTAVNNTTAAVNTLNTTTAAAAQAAQQSASDALQQAVAAYQAGQISAAQLIAAQNKFVDANNQLIKYTAYANTPGGLLDQVAANTLATAQGVGGLASGLSGLGALLGGGGGAAEASQYINTNNAGLATSVYQQQQAYQQGGPIGTPETGAIVPSWLQLGSTQFVGTMNDFTAAAGKLGITVDQYAQALEHGGGVGTIQTQSIVDDFAKANKAALVDLAATHTQQLAQLTAMLSASADLTGGVSQIAQEFAGSTISVQEFTAAVANAAASAKATADAAKKAADALYAASLAASDQQQKLNASGQGVQLMGARIGDLVINLGDLATRIYGASAAFSTLTTNAYTQNFDMLFRTAEAIGNSPNTVMGRNPGFTLATADQIAAAIKAGNNATPGLATASGPSVYGSAQGGITINFHGPVVGGTAGMRDLTNQIGNAVIDKLRGAGQKF